MPNNLYLYYSFDNWTARQTAEEIDMFNGEAFEVRVNTPGGKIAAGFAILSKLGEANVSRMVVDGEAYSMGAFATLFAEEVEANEYAEFMFHKIAYPSYYEPTDEEQKTADAFNERMKKKMLKKGIDADFVAKVFAEGERKDCYLTAKEALKFGVITKVNKIGKIALDEQRAKAAKAAYLRTQKQATDPQHKQTKKSAMTLAELKGQHPALVAELKEATVAEERERVTSLLSYVKTDDKSAAAAALNAVKSGDSFMSKFAELNQLQLAEMQVKSAEAENVPNVENDPTTPQEDKTKAAPKSAEKEAYDADEALVFGKLGINAKKA